MGVTDRRHGHRVAPWGDEQRPQQLELGRRGVLELVEQHGAETLPLDGADVGEGHGEPGGQRHLVGEVHRVALALEPQVALDHGQHPGPRAQLLAHLLDVAGQVLAAAGARGQRGECLQDLIEVCRDLTRRDEVLGQLAGEVDHRRGHRGLGELHVVHRPVVAGDHLGGVLPGRCLREQPRLGLVAQPQGMLADEPTGIRVVGRDGRSAPEHLGTGLTVVGGRLPHPALLEQPQPAADPLGQLGRGLAGEGQAEHLVGLDDAVGHQPHDASGHRLGLARTGAGHHQQRGQRRLDDLDLLVGGLRLAQGTGDVLGRDHRAGRPSQDTPLGLGRAGRLARAHRAPLADRRLEGRARHALARGRDEVGGPPGLVVLGQGRLGLQGRLDQGRLADLEKSGAGRDGAMLTERTRAPLRAGRPRAGDGGPARRSWACCCRSCSRPPAGPTRRPCAPAGRPCR